ncbi:sensor histidine kinase [Streptomyces monticola]|uniref:histidine kinase n=1 Tax=Streptomyces monticola TaxID=2666263 RepID=A0ABW2JTZ9_9ACTN
MTERDTMTASSPSAAPPVSAPWRPSPSDIALSAAVAAVGALEALTDEPYGLLHPHVWVRGLLPVALGAVVVLIRRWPVHVALFVMLSDLLFYEPVALAVAMFGVGAYARSRSVRIALTLCAMAAHSWAQIGPRQSAGHILTLTLLLVALPELIGLYARSRQALASVAVVRARQLEREQELIADRARAQEQKRIAREMHDVLSHRIAHLVIRAGALQSQPDRGPEAVAEEAAQIRTLGRTALAELRDVLGVLSAASGRTDADFAPQPTLDDLHALVDQARGLGTPVEWSGPPPAALDIAPSVQRAAYRLVQEGLTNAAKHAHGAPVRIDLATTDDQRALRVRVVNEAATRTGAGAVPGAQSGLAGLRERIELLGGTFESGPTSSGGFALSGVIPL